MDIHAFEGHNSLVIVRLVLITGNQERLFFLEYKYTCISFTPLFQMEMITGNQERLFFLEYKYTCISFTPLFQMEMIRGSSCRCTYFLE